MKKILAAAFAVAFMNPALAVDTDAVIGGAVGGGLGAAVGSELGGRDGAIVGSALGAAVGTAVMVEDKEISAPPRKTIYREAPARSYRHVPPGHTKHWHKHKHKYK